MDNMETYKNCMSREEARAKLKALIGGPYQRVLLMNDHDREEVILSNSSVRKMLSAAASGKSEVNGFTKEQHFAVAANIGNVFKNAIKLCKHADKNGHPDITIHRFAAPLYINDAVAYITVKESTQHGKKMYSIELIKMEKLAGMLKELYDASHLGSFPLTLASLDERLGGTLEKARGSSHTPPSPSLNDEDNINGLGGTLEEVGGTSRTHFPAPSQDMEEGGKPMGAGTSPNDPTSPPRLYNDNINKLRAAVNRKNKKS